VVALHLNVEIFNKHKSHPLIYANRREFGLLFAKIRADWRTKKQTTLKRSPTKCVEHGTEMTKAGTQWRNSPYGAEELSQNPLREFFEDG